MKDHLEHIASTAIGKAIEIHRELGPGLLESVYQKCLAYELRSAGFQVEEEKPVPLVYKGVDLNTGFRIDLFVDQCFVIEVKAAKSVPPVELAKALTYLRLTGTSLGLLLNFHVPVMKEGIKRLVNDYRGERVKGGKNAKG